jgi:predicted dehydrogenase
MVLRTAIIGLNAFSNEYYQALSQLGKWFKVTVLFDHKYTNYRDQHQLPVYPLSSFREYTGQLDAVLVCSPSQTHYEMVRMALLYSINVLVCHPVADSEKKIRECYQLAQQQKTILMDILPGQRSYNSQLTDWYHLIIGGQIASTAYQRLVTMDKCLELLAKHETSRL